MQLRLSRNATDALQTSISVEHDEGGKNKDNPNDETPAVPAEQATSLASEHSRHTEPAFTFCLKDFKDNIITMRPLLCQRIYYPACIEYAIHDMTLNFMTSLFLASCKNVRLLSRHWICVAVSVFCIMTLVLILI